MRNNSPDTLTEQEALSRLTALCASSEHCQQEMVEKMKRWGLAESVQSQLMSYLTEHRYVDDERYARAFVSDKLTYNKWGPRKIEQGLWAKGIDESIRRRVLSEVEDSRYADVLRPLLESKRRSTKASSRYELHGKLMRFALGRGFTADQVRECIDESSADDFPPYD